MLPFAECFRVKLFFNFFFYKIVFLTFFETLTTIFFHIFFLIKTFVKKIFCIFFFKIIFYTNFFFKLTFKIFFSKFFVVCIVEKVVRWIIGEVDDVQNFTFFLTIFKRNSSLLFRPFLIRTKGCRFLSTRGDS